MPTNNFFGTFLQCLFRLFFNIIIYLFIRTHESSLEIVECRQISDLLGADNFRQQLCGCILIGVLLQLIAYGSAQASCTSLCTSRQQCSLLTSQCNAMVRTWKESQTIFLYRFNTKCYSMQKIKTIHLTCSVRIYIYCAIVKSKLQLRDQHNRLSPSMTSPASVTLVLVCLHMHVGVFTAGG